MKDFAWVCGGVLICIVLALAASESKFTSPAKWDIADVIGTHRFGWSNWLTYRTRQLNAEHAAELRLAESR